MNENMTMEDKLLEYLENNSILSAAKRDNLKYIIEHGFCRLVHHARGDVILSPDNPERQLILIISGSADVYSSKNGEGIMLRKLEAGNLSGVSNLFADSPFESCIVAHERCTVLSVAACGVRYLIENDREFAYSYIGFLSDRICYLNNKIKYITAQTPEGKLARYIASLGTDDVLVLPLPMNAIADILDIGRASLYRAMDTLIDGGYIIRDGKKITVLNRQKMLESYL